MSEELQCYNRGCGQKFSANSNNDDSCCHHPGEPFFHDAYKGWSCCNKKCTDFTEFLNIKGCTLSQHSNIKPPEPEKPKSSPMEAGEVIEVKPLIAATKKRPPLDTKMIVMKPQIAPSLTQIANSPSEVVEPINSGEIAIGTVCKNGGCNASYQGPESSPCRHHPGVPIFHEGLKFWSCCQKRTSDFTAFLNQVGCEVGTHVWIKEEDDKAVQCRWDFHQTATHVVVSIYAKQYCIKASVVELNPIRLNATLVFPLQANATFKLDHELQGIVNVDLSEVFMYGTKVEIKLKKAEPGSWPRLERPKAAPKQNTPTVDQITPKIEAVDLDDL